MDELQINEILSSYRDAITALIERLEAQDSMLNAMGDKISYLEGLIFDEVITPAKQAMEEQIYNSNLGAFNQAHGEKLNGYNDKLRAIEGEDFDIGKQIFDGYSALEGEKPDEEVYIDEILKQVDSQLDAIRKAMGIDEDTAITIEDKGDGSEPTIIVEDSDMEVTEEEIISEDEVESDPDELQKLEEELLQSMK